MKGVKKILANIKKYYKYAIYSSKSELKSEVATSYLNWLWWILDPLCFMMIYTFIVEIVFKTKEQYLPVFVFIGLTTWNFFNKIVSQSTKLIVNNKSIVSKVYIPKYILLLSKSFTILFKTMISFALILVLMVVFKVPFSLKMLYFVLILIPLYLISFGIGSILMHYGVFVEDLSPTTNMVLKLVFYLSGIFYNINSRIPYPYSHILLNGNPISFLMNEFRNIFIYNTSPNFIYLGIWTFIGACLSLIGMLAINKYENSYVKVI